MLPKGQSLDQFAAGQIQLLNLEQVREELGDRWPKFEHQVHLLVEATLRRILTPADIFAQIDEFEYLVIFPNLTEQKASALMYVAAAQIRQKLFGRDPAFAAIRLNATVTRVSRDKMESAADPVAVLREAALLGRAAEPELEENDALLKPAPAPWTDKYKIVPITGGGMAQGHLVADASRSPGPELDFSNLADGSHRAMQVDRTGRTAMEPEPKSEQVPSAAYPVHRIADDTNAGRLAADVSPPHGRRPDLALDALITKSAPPTAVQITRSSETPAGGAAGACAPGIAAAVPYTQAGLPSVQELQRLYEPIWDVRRQAVTAYRMKIALRVEGELIGLSEFSMTHDDPKLHWTINSAIVRKLLNQVQQSRGEKKAITVAPVGRRFIDDEAGLRFVLDQLSLLSDQERHLVVLEIGDAYFGSWPALAPRLAVIRRVCRKIGIRLSLDHREFQQVAATGATIAGGDLLDHDWSERQTLGALNAFAAGAATTALQSSVSGLATSSMVIAAVCAGFDHLSGSAIGQGNPLPLGVYPLSTEGFYLQHQAQRLQQERGTTGKGS